jgi:hypothetical protein
MLPSPTAVVPAILAVVVLHHSVAHQTALLISGTVRESSVIMATSAGLIAEAVLAILVHRSGA